MPNGNCPVCGTVGFVGAQASPAPDAYNRKLRQQLEQEWSDLQGMTRAAQEAQPATGGYFTVVYRGVKPGDEARALLDHPKMSAAMWGHAMRERDEASAALKGNQP